MGAVRDGHQDEQRFDTMGANGQPKMAQLEAKENQRQGSLRSNASADSLQGHKRVGSFFRRGYRRSHIYGRTHGSHDSYENQVGDTVCAEQATNHNNKKYITHHSCRGNLWKQCRNRAALIVILLAKCLVKRRLVVSCLVHVVVTAHHSRHISTFSSSLVRYYARSFNATCS